MSDLDARLLAAHAASDRAKLADLYEEAADAAPDETACGFYLTQAYVYALEAGLEKAASLHARLIRMGREAPET